MENLTEEKILQMFQDFGLDTEEGRQELIQLDLESNDPVKSSNQLFFRITTSTALEED